MSSSAPYTLLVLAKTTGVRVRPRRSASSTLKVPRRFTSKSCAGASRLVVTATCAAMWNTAANTRGRCIHRVGVADILDNRHDAVAVPVLQPGQVLLHPGPGQDVQDPDRVPHPGQAVGEVAADEPLRRR